MTPPDSPSCPRCLSLRVRNVEHAKKPYNLCRDCGTKSVYVPTRATIRRETAAILARSTEPRREDVRRSSLSADMIEQLQNFTPERGDIHIAARKTGLPYATVQRIRAGVILGKRRAWCRRCRAHITALPCVLCRVRRENYPTRPMADARMFSGQPELADMLLWPISCIGISIRSVNALERAGFLFVGHLVVASDEDLAIRQAKAATASEVDLALSRLGFCRGTIAEPGLPANSHGGYYGACRPGPH